MAEPSLLTSKIPAVSVKRLQLTNFRNYESVEVDIDPGVVVITGTNGSGKTNLLEAVSLLTAGRGIRNASLDEFAYMREKSATSIFSDIPWAINATIAHDAAPDTNIGTTVQITDSGKEKRIVKIDGDLQRGHNSLSDYFAICYLTPRMDSLFIEGTSSRRHYLDRLTGMLMPEHTKHLSIYEHAKSERIRLLKRRSSDEKWLGVLERRMAENGVAIAVARKEAVSMLQSAINEDISSFPKAELYVKGESEENLEKMSAIQAEDRVAEILMQTRQVDADSNRTSRGVHKADFVVTHSKKNFPAERCSTGEQKAMLLSITLASLRAKAHWSGMVPSLLLDEVVAHLDDGKRDELINAIEGLGAQCLMTGTDTPFFLGLQGKAQFLKVENSSILV